MVRIESVGFGELKTRENPISHESRVMGLGLDSKLLSPRLMLRATSLKTGSGNS